MEKKKYSKPVVVAERFEPQESVAACEVIDVVTGFYITGGWNNNQFYSGDLYQDFDGDGYYDDGEELLIPSRPDRIPRRNGSIEGSPKLITDKCYSYVGLGVLTDRNRYYSEQSPVYEITYEGLTYYFKDFHTTSTGTQKTLS